MKLAQCVSEATARERESLAAYLAAEFEMQSLDLTTKEMVDVDPAEIAQALAAWAYMQLNERGADD